MTLLPGSFPTTVLLGVIVAVGVISAIIAYLRAANFATPDEIASKGLSSIRKASVSFYGVFLPVLVGIISIYVFRYMNVRWPSSAETYFLLLAICIAVVFTVMAADVFKMRGFVELTALHILYVASFGWLVPRLMTV